MDSVVRDKQIQAIEDIEVGNSLDFVGGGDAVGSRSEEERNWASSDPTRHLYSTWLVHPQQKEVGRRQRRHRHQHHPQSHTVEDKRSVIRRTSPVVLTLLQEEEDASSCDDDGTIDNAFRSKFDDRNDQQENFSQVAGKPAHHENSVHNENYDVKNCDLEETISRIKHFPVSIHSAPTAYLTTVTKSSCVTATESLTEYSG